MRKPGFRVGPSFGVCFSPGGDWLATIGARIVVWDVDGRVRLRSAHPFSHPSSVDFSPDGQRIAIKNTSGEIVVLDGGTLEVLARHDGRPWGEGSDVMFSPCGEYLVDGSWKGSLLVRETLTGNVVWRQDGGMVSLLTCTPDRTVWVHDGGGLTVRPWPFSEDRRELEYGIGGGGDAIAIDPTATLLAKVGWDRLEVWDLAKSDGRAEVLTRARVEPVSGTGRALAWAPSSDLLGFARSGGTSFLTRDLEVVSQVPLEYACAVAFSPSGHLAALGAWSKGFVIKTTTPQSSTSGLGGY